MQVPKFTIVNVVPETEHIFGVFELKVTEREDVAVADNVIGVELNICAPGFTNVID